MGQLAVQGVGRTPHPAASNAGCLRAAGQPCLGPARLPKSSNHRAACAVRCEALRRPRRASPPPHPCRGEPVHHLGHVDALQRRVELAEARGVARLGAVVQLPAWRREAGGATARHRKARCGMRNVSERAAAALSNDGARILRVAAALAAGRPVALRWPPLAPPACCGRRGRLFCPRARRKGGHALRT